LNQVQSALSTEPRYCNKNCHWTKVRVEFELVSRFRR